MSLYIFISRIFVTHRNLKSNVAINGSKVSDETHSFTLRCTSSCRHKTNKKITILSPFHLDKSLAANLDLNFSVTPQSYSTAWEIYHILLRDLVLPSLMCALGAEQWHSAPLNWQSWFIVAICMWVDLTPPRTADGTSSGPHRASLNSARPPRAQAHEKSAALVPNWISYLGLWRKDTAMIWTGVI